MLSLLVSVWIYFLCFNVFMLAFSVVYYFAFKFLLDAFISICDHHEVFAYEK